MTDDKPNRWFAFTASELTSISAGLLFVAAHHVASRRFGEAETISDIGREISDALELRGEGT